MTATDQLVHNVALRSPNARPGRAWACRRSARRRAPTFEMRADAQRYEGPRAARGQVAYWNLDEAAPFLSLRGRLGELDDDDAAAAIRLCAIKVCRR